MNRNGVMSNLLAGWLVCVLITTVIATDKAWAAPSCADLRDMDKKIRKYEEGRAIYEFLVEYDQKWEDSPYYKIERKEADDVIEHRSGDDGQKFKETCQEKAPVFSSEKQFCQDYRNRDNYLLTKHEQSKARFREYVAREIRSNPEFIALGRGGQPLATNLDDFNQALDRYKGAQSRTRIKELKAWLEGWLERDPTIHTRCGPNLGQ